MRSIDEVADEYVEAAAAADPVTATMEGVGGHEHEMTDYSPEGFATRADLARRTLSAVENSDPNGGTQQVAVDAMRERLGLQIELYEAGITTSDLNVLASPLQNARSAFDLMATSTTEDWEAIAARLAKFPLALQGFAETLREAAGDGRPTTRRQVEACIEQCRSWLPPADDLFGNLIADAPASDSRLDAALRTGADTARRAVAEFAAFLGDLLPTAREKDAAGRETYALRSRYFLGAEIDLEETYAWGWDELHRIDTEMARVAREIVPGGTVDDAVALLDSDPARAYADKNDFRDWMQGESDRIIAELDGKHFDIPEPIRRLECRIAPTSDGIIYYTGPSEDFTRPGRMWWSVPEGVAKLTTWKELTTVYHEGVPGHHLQIAQAAYRKDILNRWQRTQFISGHGEGWALYAERLMDELGYLSEPGARLGMLDSQAFRATRVIIDIGMHLELEIPPNPWDFHVGSRWTPELGMAFLRAHCSSDEAFLRFELNRYLGWPGQAPAYKVGERIWLQAREDARARKGAEFDLKEFHRAALDLGALGLDPLRAALARI